MRYFFLVFLQFLFLSPFLCNTAMSNDIPLKETGKGSAVEFSRNAIMQAYGKLPLYFIENKGQVDEHVRFYERGAGHAAFFTRDGVVLSLAGSGGKLDNHSRHDEIIERPSKTASEVMSLSFIGANKEAGISVGERMTGRVNYFVGNDKSKWRANIPTYRAVTYKDVYKNIDVKFYGSKKNIEHDIIVGPGGDITNVKFAYKGIKGLKVTDSGDLEVILTRGSITENRPVIYQEIDGKRVAVEGAYRILEGQDGTFVYGFDVASYDHTKQIVIDPVLDYSTYLGGAGDDIGRGIAVDSSGAVYITGVTLSPDFPLLSPVQAIHNPFVRDVFITKLSPMGSSMVYSTYLGGNNWDEGQGIAVDSSGSVYVTGDTASTDFPLAAPMQGASAGGFEAFITKLNPSGSALVYSTYLGGNSGDYGTAIAVDGAGSAYVTGHTFSPDFPLNSPSPIQPSHGGGLDDVFVTKINALGSAIIYSTYLGGMGNDRGFAIAVDGSGAAYVTGDTSSFDYPLMSPVQPVSGGTVDVFVSKINSSGSALAYSTYLGGAGWDIGKGIAVDSTGAAYVTGNTASTDFPLAAPIQGFYGGGPNDAFITKIVPSGLGIAYSTYLGGGNDEDGAGIAVDSAGSAYVTGSTLSADFPVVSPLQASSGGSWDIYAAKLTPSGAAYVYSTYLGGSSFDFGSAIALGGSGSVYLTGDTMSTDFPLLTPVQASNGGSFDVFITKIIETVPPPPVAVTLTITPDTVSVARGSTLGYTVTAANTTAITQCFKYWENVTLPGGVVYPPAGELFGPVNLCLNAGASRTAHLTHGVPMSAPVGAYIFNTFVGTHPTPVTSEAHFNFNVTAFGAVTNHMQTSWRLLENGFKK